MIALENKVRGTSDELMIKMNEVVRMKEQSCSGISRPLMDVSASCALDDF